METKDILILGGLVLAGLILIAALLYFQKTIPPKNKNYRPGDGPEPWGKITGGGGSSNI